jgi:plastocyanin
VLPLAAETLFVYFGAVLAAWAVLLAFLGLSRATFPGKGPTGERVVIGISVVLVAAAIGTAIGTAKQGKKASEATAAPAKPTSNTAQVHLSTDPSGQLRFNTTSLQARAGSVQLILANPSPIQHNISIQGPGVNAQGPTVGHGSTSTVSASLKPGTYTFYCSVPGHRQAGMQGTLTVK